MSDESSRKQHNFRSSDAAALVSTAKSLYRAKDFGQVIELIESIPGSYRTQEALRLHEMSKEAQEEIDYLIADLEQAKIDRDYTGVTEGLDRLLKLKPGYGPALDLLEELDTYGGEVGNTRAGKGDAHYNNDDGLGRPLLYGGVAVLLLGLVVFLVVNSYLKSHAASITIHNQHAGVDVMLDGETLTFESANAKRPLTAGRHTINLSSQGQPSQVVDVEAKKGDELTYRVSIDDGTLALTKLQQTKTPKQIDPVKPEPEPVATPVVAAVPPTGAVSFHPAGFTGPVQIGLTEQFRVDNIGIIDRVDFAPDGREVAIAQSNTGYVFFDAQSGTENSRIKKWTDIRTTYISYMEDESRLVLGLYNGGVFLIDREQTTGEKPVTTHVVPADSHWITKGGRWSNSTNWSASSMGAINIYDSAGIVVTTFPQTGDKSFQGGTVGHPGTGRFAKTTDSKLWLYDVKSNKAEPHEFPGRKLKGIAFNHDGSLFAISADEKLLLCDVASMTVLHEWDIGMTARKIEISSNGQLLALTQDGSSKGALIVRLPDQLDGELTTEFRSFGRVSDLSWSPDSTKLAVINGLGGDLAVWNVTLSKAE